jgi:hypothetical protein
MSLPPLPNPYYTDGGAYDSWAPLDDLWSAEQMRAFYAEGVRAGMEQAEPDAKRYRWLVENAVIDTAQWLHDGRDPASTKQPLDNAIDAAIRAAAKQPPSENHAAQAPGYQYNGTQGQLGAAAKQGGQG